MDGHAHAQAMLEYDKGLEYYQKKLYPQALRHFQQAIDFDGGLIVAYFFLAQVKTFAPNDPLIPQYEKMSHLDDLSEVSRQLLHFALAKIYVDVGLPALSVAQAKLGHQYTKTVDWESRVAYWNRIQRVFNQTFLQQSYEVGRQGVSPIFVVAPPHSGLAQVQSWFSQNDSVSVVHSGGMDAVIAQLNMLEEGEGFPESCRLVGFEWVQQCTDSYLHVLHQSAGSATQVIDVLESVEYLGLVSQLFPQAKIVLLQRDPLEQALAQFLDYEGPSFASDLTVLGVYHQGYRKLLQHWLMSLPVSLQVLQIQYDELMNESSVALEQVLKFCQIDLVSHQRGLRLTAVTAVELPGWSDLLHLHVPELMQILYGLTDERAAAYLQLGVKAMSQGDLSLANRLLRRACKVSEPPPVAAFAYLVALNELKSLDEVVPVIVNGLKEAGASAEQSRLAREALANYYLSTQDYEQAWQYLESSPTANEPIFDSVLWPVWLENIQSTFTAKKLGNSAIQPRGMSPIFILGFSKQGRELLARGLLQHQVVAKASGGLSVERLVEWAESISGEVFPKNVERFTRQQLSELSVAYWSEHCACVSGPVMCLVDSGDQHYLYAGFLASLFPQAKFLYCEQPEELNAVSLLLDGRQKPPCSGLFDVASCEVFLSQCAPLIQHWQKTIPGWLAVSLDDLLADPVQTWTQIFQFVQLEYTENSRILLETQQAALKTLQLKTLNGCRRSV
ncbi:MAG: sulfotransferase [Methylococcales bacterium]|nr:sulfotransferase [Methylococcales bacterium]